MVEMREPETVVRLEAPGGVVEARAACRDGRCESVEFTNVPCFADRLDAPLEVEGLGTIAVDVAYGGMWYAIADAAALGFAIEPRRGARPLARRRADPRRRARAAAVRAPGEPGDRRRQHRPDRRAVAGRRRGDAGTRSSSRPAGSTARRPAPGSRRGMAVAARPRPDERRRRDDARVGDRLDVRRPDRLRDAGRRPAGDRAGDPRQRLDHRRHAALRRPRRPVPGGLPALRHLGRQRARHASPDRWSAVARAPPFPHVRGSGRLSARRRRAEARRTAPRRPRWSSRSRRSSSCSRRSRSRARARTACSPAARRGCTPAARARLRVRQRDRDVAACGSRERCHLQ